MGISLHIKSGFAVWRIPFGFQLVPAGLMAFGLLTVKESPRWLASQGRSEEAFANLAYLRRRDAGHSIVREEMAEIEAAIVEEREARKGLGAREAFLGKGNFIRFVIAAVIFLLQQWSGQNSVGYYAPQIFSSVSPPAFIRDCCFFAMLSQSGADWLRGHVELSARVWDLRHREGRRDRDIRVLHGRLARAQALAVHLGNGHGRAVLHHWRAPQDVPPALHRLRRAPPAREQGDGRDVLPLRLLLLDGLGTASVSVK